LNNSKIDDAAGLIQPVSHVQLAGRIYSLAAELAGGSLPNTTKLGA